MSSSSGAYQEALSRIQHLIPEGFIKADKSEIVRDQLIHCLNQHNLLIQLNLDLHQKVDQLLAEVKILKRAQQSEENIADLVSKLEHLSLGPSEPKVQQKGKFFAFKDPYVILEEVKQKKPSSSSSQ